jgi:hypothetical protein
MAFTVEYTFTRPSTDVSWAYTFSAAGQTQINSLRAQHGVSVTESTSEDGLTYKLTQSAADHAGYSAYYYAANDVWEAEGIMYACNTAGITVSLNLVENT